MKALSVHGNYVLDMIAGKKKIEYRTWYTKYRGDLLMCSTAKKIAGTAPGYALCVVNLYDVDYSEDDDLYYWHIKDVRPISEEQFDDEIKDYIYIPKRRKTR